MEKLWSFLGVEDNRARISLIGGGVVVIAGGLWAAYVHFFPTKDEPHAAIQADCGSVAVSGPVSGATINASGGTDCEAKPK